MKINEERYIRTYDGFIRKIKVVSKENAPLVLCVINGKPYTVDDIKNASPNIIDLVEVGDYVNGYYVDRAKYHYMGEDFIDFEREVDAGSGYGYQLLAKDIKSIITREQIEQVKYVVE